VNIHPKIHLRGLYQRNIVETVIDQLKSICHIEHFRHRSPINFRVVNRIGGLAADSVRLRKPRIKINKLEHAKLQLIHN